MYKVGTYTVKWETANGEYRVSRVFETEQEARYFGNFIWNKPNIKSVQINRREFYKQRRHSVIIAKATK